MIKVLVNLVAKFAILMAILHAFAFAMAQHSGAAEEKQSANTSKVKARVSDARVNDAISELRKRNLLIPIEGVAVERLKGSFSELRGSERHEATDIAAARNTPVRAVEDGSVTKLFYSKFGGNTIYQLDPTGEYIYYYAHLEGYEPSLKEGAKIKRGQVIGFVGTSGNAPANSPHLHFSVGILTPEKKWWQTHSIDPYEVLKATK